MKKYHLFELAYNSSGIRFMSTENELEKWILTTIDEKLKDYIQKGKTYHVSSRFDILSGWNIIGGLLSKDMEVGQFIKQQLCEIGWEPFNVLLNGSTTIYYFRKEVIEP